MCAHKFRYGLIDSSVFVEPAEKANDGALQIDLRSGKILSVKTVGLKLQKESLGIIGASDLGDGGWALCLITSAEWVRRALPDLAPCPPTQPHTRA